MRKLFRLFNREDGITGLETAIILIAFVIVALAAGGFPISLDPSAYTNTVVVNWIDAQDRVPDCGYTVTWILDDGDDLLEVGELAEVTVNPPAGSRPVD